jgi:HlyD family secretion protein
MNRPFRTAPAQSSEIKGAPQYDRRADTRVEDDPPESLIVHADNRRIRNRRIVLVVLLILLSLAAGLGYFFAVPGKVTHYVVTPGTMVFEVTGPGILDATNKVTITSRIPGFLNSIHVERNDRVTVGQVIAELDAGDIQSQLEGALADVDAAKSAVSEAVGNRTKAKAAADKASSDLARRRGLSASGVVSQVELDTLEIALRQAMAEYDTAVAVEERARAQVRVASAQVGVLQHKRNEAQIRSPLDGVVVSRDRSTGDLLTAGVQLFQIVEPKSIVISTRLDESIMGLIESGQAARVRFTSDPVQVIDAKVARVSRIVDPETREFMVDLSPERLPKNWAMGQRAQVAIDVLLPPDTLVVAVDFVARRDGRAGVWHQVSGRAVWTPIEVVAVSGKYAQVVKGVSPGDIILEPRGRYTFEPVAIERSPR